MEEILSFKEICTKFNATRNSNQWKHLFRRFAYAAIDESGLNGIDIKELSSIFDEDTFMISELIFWMIDLNEFEDEIVPVRFMSEDPLRFFLKRNKPRSVLLKDSSQFELNNFCLAKNNGNYHIAKKC